MPVPRGQESVEGLFCPWLFVTVADIVLALGTCHADDPDSMKNIILCSDGTGNSAIKGRGTNVFKLFEAVDLNEHLVNPALDTQLAF